MLVYPKISNEGGGLKWQEIKENYTTIRQLYMHQSIIKIIIIYLTQEKKLFSLDQRLRRISKNIMCVEQIPTLKQNIIKDKNLKKCHIKKKKDRSTIRMI